MYKKLDNVTLNWARLDTPVPNFGKTANQYEVECLISAEQKNELEGMHVNKTSAILTDLA